MQSSRRITLYLDEYVQNEGWVTLPHFFEADEFGNMVSQGLRELRNILTPSEFKNLLERLAEETNQLQLYEHTLPLESRQIHEV